MFLLQNLPLKAVHLMIPCPTFCYMPCCHMYVCLSEGGRAVGGTSYYDLHKQIVCNAARCNHFGCHGKWKIQLGTKFLQQLPMGNHQISIKEREEGKIYRPWWNYQPNRCKQTVPYLPNTHRPKMRSDQVKLFLLRCLTSHIMCSIFTQTCDSRCLKQYWRFQD